jgi:hypothetical protein
MSETCLKKSEKIVGILLEMMWSIAEERLKNVEGCKVRVDSTVLEQMPNINLKVRPFFVVIRYD